MVHSKLKISRQRNTDKNINANSTKHSISFNVYDFLTSSICVCVCVYE